MSIRLLIVDDSSAMRKMVERALRMADVEIGLIVEASNGKEALDVLARNTVDLILCDINMPEMDGLEFLKRRSAEGNAGGVPVVMITSESGESEVVQALSLGASCYIRKPFTARHRVRIFEVFHATFDQIPRAAQPRIGVESNDLHRFLRAIVQLPLCPLRNELVCLGHTGYSAYLVQLALAERHAHFYVRNFRGANPQIRARVINQVRSCHRKPNEQAQLDEDQERAASAP